MKKILRTNFYSIKRRGEAEPAKNRVFGGKNQFFSKKIVVDYGGLFPDLLSTMGGGCFASRFPGNFLAHIKRHF
jgi:hypothetical protein